MADGSEKNLQKVAVSLKDKRDANATMGWFVKTATFPPRQGIAVKPLINGQRMA